MIAIHTEADFPDELRSLDASEWKKAPLFFEELSSWQSKANKK